MITVRIYRQSDLPELIRIWNEVVADGTAFPQEELFNEKTGADFFASQTLTAAAEENGIICGLYILHPNNIGRCGHIANASFAVGRSSRGHHIGEMLVRDCIQKAGEKGFKILQFNAVVESNLSARKLYEKLGFCQLGTIPRGFRKKDGSFENICPYYISLESV